MNMKMWILKAAQISFIVQVASSCCLAQGVYEAWVARYTQSTTSAERANAIAVDSADNIYVAGYTHGDNERDCLVVKYAANGDTLWTRIYNGPSNGHDEGIFLGVDESSNVFVAGVTHGDTTLFDYLLMKYDRLGNLVWIRTYNGLGNADDIVQGFALDKNGYVYLTGKSYGGASNFDFVTIKYDSEGNVIWVRKYNGPGNYSDEPWSIAVDKAGNIIVVGSVQYFDDVFPQYDFAVVKYSSDGESLWTRFYGPVNSTDRGYSVAVDTSLNIYICGSTGVYPDFDYCIIKYSSAGEELWVKKYNGMGNCVDEARYIAVDNLGHVYVTGWSGNACSFPFYYFYDIVTIQFNQDGESLWIKTYNGGVREDTPSGLNLDSAGNIYVIGTSKGTSTFSDFVTIKYSLYGNEEWVKRYNGSGNGQDEASALALDKSGDVYVTGVSAGSASYDCATIKYSPCYAIPGDVNVSGTITLGDIIHVVNYVFDKDKLPCLGTDPGNCWTAVPFCRGDVNQSSAITLGDIIHLVNYIFDKDRLPCQGTEPGNCWTPEANGACCLPVP